MEIALGVGNWKRWNWKMETETETETEIEIEKDVENGNGHQSDYIFNAMKLAE